jgi:hypothetical protein
MSSLGYLTCSLFKLYVQRLDRDATEVAEVREEVTWPRVAAIIVETHATRAERMAQERVVLLATARGEVYEVAQRVSSLEDELVTTSRAQDASEEKLLILSAKAAAAEQRRVAVEEHCECLVHELSLLSLKV